ncbi:hypothetical protein B0H17DRAFT_1012383 [Mycena rosella]|uniref:Uncharacterized protein n=1 Tax=Mycena rosella TaxID=1033263 RepID=A0AAD7DDE5_MYCRO|nr:hypothetical protein B0H17DRAFT_1012383 [Mycena rosella]
MQFSKSTQLVAIALCTLQASAGPLSAPSTNNNTLATRATAVRIGALQSDGSTVAWVAGVSQCSASLIKQDPGNFCELDFTLDGLSGQFTVEGCGGPLWLERDGSFYANCPSYSEAGACGVTTEWSCS